MSKQLVALISTKGKTPEQVHKEIVRATIIFYSKYNFYKNELNPKIEAPKNRKNINPGSGSSR